MASRSRCLPQPFETYPKYGGCLKIRGSTNGCFPLLFQNKRRLHPQHRRTTFAQPRPRILKRLLPGHAVLLPPEQVEELPSPLRQCWMRAWKLVSQARTGSYQVLVVTFVHTNPHTHTYTHVVYIYICTYHIDAYVINKYEFARAPLSKNASH